MCLPVKPFAVLKEWDHAGLKCAVSQAHEYGHLCGYVRVPPGHPLYGKDYDGIPVEVHGGVTFAEQEPCAHEDGQGWWFGFDCGHSLTDVLYDPQAKIPWLDELPVSFRTFMQDPGRHFAFCYRKYWRQPEVEAQVRSMAEQLAAVAV